MFLRGARALLFANASTEFDVEGDLLAQKRGTRVGREGLFSEPPAQFGHIDRLHRDPTATATHVGSKMRESRVGLGGMARRALAAR
jgi:hypothetical protein